MKRLGVADEARETMNTSDIVRAAIPDASDELCNHVLWGRTAFPFVQLTARDLYRAASAFWRAQERGNQLCDMCHRLEQPGRWLCVKCDKAMTPNVGVEPHSAAGKDLK